MDKVMQTKDGNFAKNGHKWTLCKQIESVKVENNCKLTPLLNRRSYNDHMGSENFINLLDGASNSSGRESFERNIKIPDVVSHNAVKLLNNNEEDCQCIRSSTQLLQRSPFCFKTSALPNQMSVDVASQSDFASQTLKPFSTQNLEWIPFDDPSCECRNGNAKYKLKETSPGCLPSKKGKSKKLQRKGSGKMEQDVNPESPKDDRGTKENNEVKMADERSQACAKVQRKSFISSVIKFAKFGRKKKRRSEEPAQEICDDSNWGTESSSSERRNNSSGQDEEFIFGGVRVFFDENGEFCEVGDEDDDEVYDGRSVSTYSECESESDGPTRRTRTKFESLDSLNLGYSGSFVS